MNLDHANPFEWYKRTEPSIFAKDKYFTPKADGKTDSQRATDTVENLRSKGVDPGTLHHIGKPSKEKEDRLLAYKQFGTYSRAKPSARQPNKHEQ
jgi:hypothetical protein